MIMLNITKGSKISGKFLEFNELNFDFEKVFVFIIRCAACFKCFLTSNKLKFHIRRNHLPIENDNYICKIKSCKKDCKNQRLLLNHQKSHINVECPYCTDTISALNYMTHVRSHTGTVSVKRRSSNEKAKGSRKPRQSADTKGKKVTGGKCVKAKVRQKKEPKEPTVRANLN